MYNAHKSDIIFWRNLFEFGWKSIDLDDVHCRILWSGQGSTSTSTSAVICQLWANLNSKRPSITARFFITQSWPISSFCQ